MSRRPVVPLSFTRHGDASRPAVILLQGLGMASNAWPAELVDALVETGLQVVLPDNRDAGKSPRVTGVRVRDVEVLGGEDRELADFRKIAVEALLTAQGRDRRRLRSDTLGLGHVLPNLSSVDRLRRTPDGHPANWATGSLYTRKRLRCMRVSSITKSQLVDKFRHVLRQIACETERFARHRMDKAKLGRMQGLPGKAESLQIGAQGFGGTAIGRVSQ